MWCPDAERNDVVLKKEHLHFNSLCEISRGRLIPHKLLRCKCLFTYFRQLWLSDNCSVDLLGYGRFEATAIPALIKNMFMSCEELFVRIF